MIVVWVSFGIIVVLTVWACVQLWRMRQHR